MNENNRAQLWYNDMLPNLQADDMIHLRKLIPGHPLLRQIELIEVKLVISIPNSNKALGPSSITVLQLKHISPNFIVVINNMTMQSWHIKYFPNILLNINMIFFGKPNSDTTNPKNH